MCKLIILLKYEFKNLKTRYDFGSNLFWMLIISGICMPMITQINQINTIGPLLMVTLLPVLILSRCNKLFREDISSGILDFLIINYNSLTIIVSKFIAIYLNCVIVTLLCTPIFTLLFDLTFHQAILLSICSMIISLHTCALCVLVSVIDSYFDKSKMLVASIIMPLLIPVIIICGIVIQNQHSKFLYLALGISMLVATITICCASLLIKNYSH